MKAVTQWFMYRRFPADTGCCYRPKRAGWYEVQRGESKLKWMAQWNGGRFYRFRCLDVTDFEPWLEDVMRNPEVTAFRGLAEKP